MKKSSGFTLVETLVATAILTIVLVSALESFNRFFDAITFSNNQYRYTMEVEAELDELLYQSEKNFDDVLNLNNTATFLSAADSTTTSISDAYNTATFLSAADASGTIYASRKIYVTNLDPGTTATTTCLLKVKAVICWRDKNRVFGEDQNLNGVLDAGEDINKNGEIDSPCQAETVLVRKD